jgi:hypothetical protein
MKYCPNCRHENPEEIAQCAMCGTQLPDTPLSPAGDATGGIIPYKNPQALSAYYLGIFSGLPLIGLPLGIVAFVLGIKGLQARRKDPAIKGSIHASIGIGCGCFFSVLWSVAVVLIIIGIATANKR